MASKKATTKRAASAAKKTAQPDEPEVAARNRQNAARRAMGKADTTRNHDANPDVSTDSSVRHAEPQTGKQRGEGHGGYPSGEYDVTTPGSSRAQGDVLTKGPQAIALDQLYAGSPEAEQAVKQANERLRLSPDQFDQAVEALPVGTVIEKEAPWRWRVHVVGQPRFGHGQTHSEAVENYVLGDQGTSTAQAEADRALAQMDPKQQQEIADRDAKAAQAVGGTPPDTFARIENAKAAAADATAEPPAPNAATDGAEKASARDEAGRSAAASSGYTLGAEKETPGTEGVQAR